MLAGSPFIRRGLVLLVAAAACALCASSALAAQHHRARPAHPRTAALLKPKGAHPAKASAYRQTASSSAVHNITSCGYTANAPGTYNVTRNLTGTGGTCITIDANHVTLNLNSHTITGIGSSDECIYVGTTPGGYESLGDSVNGHRKGAARANLNNCGYGLYLDYTSGAKASGINFQPAAGYYGVYEYYASGAKLSWMTVTGPTGVYGYYGEYGAGNTVSHFVVNQDSSDYAFYSYYEYGNKFTNDTAKDTYSTTGNSGYGFYDEDSNRNTFSGNKSLGYEYAFYLYEDYDGSVIATNNVATYPSASSSSGYGFYVYYAFDYYTYSQKVHTLISGNKTDGFEYGYYDYTDSSYDVRETYSGNTADNYTSYGFYFYYPTDYTITNNTADANTTSTASPRWVSGAYGMYFYDPYSYSAPLTFSGNGVYDNEYGYYSDGYAMTGSHNIARRNKYNSYGVQYNS